MRRFVAATMRGLDDAMKNPKAAGEIMNKHHKQVDVDIGTAETEKVKQLAPQAGLPLGTIDNGRMQRTIDIVAAAFKHPPAIVAFEVPVDRLEGKVKLGQNRDRADREGVIAGLRREAGHEGERLARWVARYR